MTASERFYLILVLAMALIYATQMGQRTADSLRLSLSGPAAQTSSAGQPRQVDMHSLEEQIKRGTLSDHEAMHYKKVGEGTSQGIAPARK